MKELAKRFLDRFEGLDRARGEYKTNGQVSSKGKHQGHANTVREGATVDHWVAHLQGESGLGIVPIKDNGCCRFGAVDIDTYTGDLGTLADQISRLELPLILCRSKSGGPHLYLFLREDVPAELVRGKLMDWAVALGYSGVEVFPKQTRLASGNDVGNWINMPFFNLEETDRYAIFDGHPLSAEKFLELADIMAVDAETLRETNPKLLDESSEMWDQAPPCLQSLAMRGFGEGSRNNALFNIAVYLRKRYGDDGWEDKLDEYNQTFMDPPLGHKEVSQIVRSSKKKTYQYRCSDSPINAACNKQICLTRKYGIGAVEGDPGVVFGTLVKLETDPPTWIWDVDGARLELTTNDLKDQTRFHTKCMETLNKWPHPVKPKDWAEIVRGKLESVEVVDVPPDATGEGQMWALLQDYCVGKQKARTREELLMNRPWTNEGRTYFSSIAFRQYLEQNKMRVTERQLWNWLRKRGAEHKFFNIKNRGLNLWSVPSFEEQNEAFEIPRLEQEEAM